MREAAASFWSAMRAAALENRQTCGMLASVFAAGFATAAARPARAMLASYVAQRQAAPNFLHVLHLQQEKKNRPA